MKFITVAGTAGVLLGAVAAAPVEDRTILQTDLLAAEALLKLKLNIATNGYPNKQCKLSNAAKRREWSTLSSSEKKLYISAVHCLANKPARTPAALSAGAKNRYDDFVATHINQTINIHGTGNFLAWHRYFTWAYEQALRDECGYMGYQPYYNWPKWASDPANSPALDGSDTSLSGDGTFVAGREDDCVPSPDQCNIRLPPGNGGGCVESGPFTNWTVNLGPVVLPNPAPWLGYNPRCLTRDISKTASQGWTKDSDVSSLIQQNKNFWWFSQRMQGDFPSGFLGVHTAGHFTIGGDPGGDLFVSPGDPFFYLHHAMIDRTWWTWQNMDIRNRVYSVQGNVVFGDPTSRNTTLDDEMDLGYAGFPTVTIRDVSHTLGGPLCYIYT